MRSPRRLPEQVGEDEVIAVLAAKLGVGLRRARFAPNPLTPGRKAESARKVRQIAGPRLRLPIRGLREPAARFGEAWWEVPRIDLPTRVLAAGRDLVRL